MIRDSFDLWSDVTMRQEGSPVETLNDTPRIVADAAAWIFAQPRGALNGQTLIDADVLTRAGVTDLSIYGGGDNPRLDLYVDPA